MEYLPLGKSGLKVSKLCLGTMIFGKIPTRDWHLEEDDSRALVKAALDLGVNFFDTADAYSNGQSEEILGRSVRALTSRHRVVIATKLWAPTSDDANGRGLSRKHIFESIDFSLKRLGTDYVDLYQIHKWDHETPIEETLDALNDVVRSGRVRYLGASSMYAWQFMKAIGLQRQHGWSQFISMQNHYNLIYREEEREMIPLCLSEGIGVVPWSPLARGFLARRYTGSPDHGSSRQQTDDILQAFYGTQQDFQILQRLNEVAEEAGSTPASIAIAWLAGRSTVTAMVGGPRNVEHLRGITESLKIKLSRTQLDKLDELYQPKAVVGIDLTASKSYPLVNEAHTQKVTRDRKE